jgi:hypothetical protein
MHPGATCGRHVARSRPPVPRELGTDDHAQVLELLRLGLDELPTNA